MDKVSLLFGIHMHQPVDNFGDAVDEAIDLCYRPFFETMRRFKDFKFSVHCSGWLLDRIRNNHADIFKNMKELTDAGSIEWIGAGYYEPVLSAIPSKDRQAQILKLTRYIQKHLGVTPKGLWLTERVWESSLVPDLSAAGMAFAVVDDYHFLSSGFDADKMDGYYTTEESGEELGLFPIAQSLRYALPFFSVKRALDTIIARAQNKHSAAIIFDDAEKFGLWPQTHEWVYEKKWLEQFVSAVLEHPQIQTRHYDEYYQKERALGLAYLNNTSYFEMGEWSLRAKQTRALEALKTEVGESYFNEMGVAFIKGGIWKNFFIKYHESNYLHKRMLYFSKKQHRLSQENLESLYKLQTNDVFWHGVFGGLYLPNLRDNAYRYLLEIEKSQTEKKIAYEVSDIDKDGYEELKVRSAELSVVFSSRYGGQMMEFGSFSALFNWQNTLMRREEAYHDKILHPEHNVHEKTLSEDEIATIHNDVSVEDEALKALLIYDWHPKYSFIDHFSDAVFDLPNFRALSFKEVGDFANQPFELHPKKRKFTRDGGIYLDRHYPAKLKKSYSFENAMLALDLKFESKTQQPLHYACEMNLHFAHPDKVTFNGQTLDEGLSLYDIETLIIEDDFTQQRLKLSSSVPADFFGYILKTVSQSESGFDSVAQGISFILTTPCFEKMRLKITLELENVRN